MMPPADDALRTAFTDEWGRVVAAVIARTGDWALAEECAQDAFAVAAERWAVDGVPERPGAWLTTVARRRAIDRLRRSGVEGRALAALSADRTDDREPDEIPDDRLRLVFACCHPALPMDARVALTLRTLCGLEVAEIARAFGVSEGAMAKRLVRARQRIAHTGIPFRIPTGSALDTRVDGVLTVLYLLFTEGYTPSAGPDATRSDLSGEAIRLAALLTVQLPTHPDARALLALLLLHDARRPARTDGTGALVPLAAQDRTRWDRVRIERGSAELRTAVRQGAAGRYALQAQIALLHDEARDAGATDWPRIAALYERLVLVDPSPQAVLARAVAVAAAHGPDAGLAVLDEVRAHPQLAGDHYLPATEAELLRTAGRLGAAADAYRRALGLVRTAPERAHLEQRLAGLDAG